MTTGMALAEYLRLVAEHIEAAEDAQRPTEALRLIEILRDELTDQVTRRVAALPGAPT